MVRTSQLLALMAAISTATAYTYHAGNKGVGNPFLSRRIRETLPPMVLDRVGDADECQLTGFCENDDNYPTALAESLIAQLDDKKNYFSMDELDVPQVTDRYGGGGGTKQDICHSKTKIVYPKSGLDRHGNKHSILNSEAHRVQGILVEVCRPGTVYKADIVKFQPGWSGKCNQQYVYRIMTTIDVDGRTLRPENIRVPSACSLVAYPDND